MNYTFNPGEIPRSIIVARWDPQVKSLDHNTIITGDANYAGFL